MEDKIKEQEEQIENIIMELRIRGLYIETLKKDGKMKGFYILVISNM